MVREHVAKRLKGTEVSSATVDQVCKESMGKSERKRKGRETLMIERERERERERGRFGERMKQ